MVIPKASWIGDRPQTKKLVPWCKSQRGWRAWLWPHWILSYIIDHKYWWCRICSIIAPKREKNRRRRQGSIAISSVPIECLCRHHPELVLLFLLGIAGCFVNFLHVYMHVCEWLLFVTEHFGCILLLDVKVHMLNEEERER